MRPGWRGCWSGCSDPPGRTSGQGKGNGWPGCWPRKSNEKSKAMKIKVTRATLIEDGGPVCSKAVEVCCDSEQLEDVRSTLKAELVQEMAKGTAIDLQYREVREG